MLLEAGLQKGEKGQKREVPCASIDLECRSDEKL